MSEKHNHSLSSINSLLEKKNHCIMIVVSWCNKADQKPILNQFFEQRQRERSVSGIQVH